MDNFLKSIQIVVENGRIKVRLVRPMHGEVVCEVNEESRPKMLGWADIPDIVLEQIYGYLSYKERYRCSMVCYNWYIAFYSPRIWRRLIYDETTFSDVRHNLLGSELCLNQERVKKYLRRVGRHVKYITVPETLDFHNVYNFLIVLVAYLQFFEEYPMPLLHSFNFTFACESRIPVVGPVVLGTGGRFLEMIIQLLGNLKNVKSIVLNNLLLESVDAPSVLGKIVENGHQSLVSLEILNFTKERCPLFQVGMLHSLNKLVISPSQLTDDVILMLARGTRLENLVLVQDKYTKDADSVTSSTWREVREINSQLRVQLEIRGIIRKELLLQDRAPVWCIIEATPYNMMSTPTAFQVIDNYRRTLKIYAQLTLPRKYGERSFHSRGDSGFVLMIRECLHLQTLIIRERISTASILVIAYEGSLKSLRELFVRRNAVLLRSDWPKPPLWDNERYYWLKQASQSYEAVEREVSELLGQQWHMLSDAEFKQLSLSQ